MFQETLMELFPLWENVRRYEEVIAFTCGLMKDPTPLVTQVYETYIKYLCDYFRPGGCYRDTAAESRLRAQGKNIGDISLFYSIYTESPVTLCGFPGYNQYVYLNNIYEGKINMPSKLYLFSEVSADAVSDAKFVEQEGSEEVPECILCINKANAITAKFLLSTCCKISKLQPVNRLIMVDICCKDLIHTKNLTLSKNIQSVYVIHCDLPMNFWKDLLHQLSNCEDLQTLFLDINLYQLEEDLEKLLKNLNSRRRATNQQIEVNLNPKKLSLKFVKK